MKSKKKASITSLKRELSQIKKDLSKKEGELYAYKNFTTNLFKQSLINLTNKQYTPSEVFIKDIQRIWVNHSTPVIYWNDK